MVDAGLASTPDHGARLTVITLNPGSRSMWTSKTKGPGQVESVRSSATVLATIGCRVQLRPSDYRGSPGDAFCIASIVSTEYRGTLISFVAAAGERRRVEPTVTIWLFCVCLPDD